MNIDEAREALRHEIALRQHYQEEARQLKTELDEMKYKCNTIRLKIPNMVKAERIEAVKDFAKIMQERLDDMINLYGNAGHDLNVYSWVKAYLDNAEDNMRSGENG